MNEQEINAAIAEAVGTDKWYAVEKAGWYYRPNARGYTNRIEEAGRYTKEDARRLLVRGEPMSIVRIPPPNYVADLNAMHEAEKLFEREESLEAFAENLAVVVFGECPDALLRYSDAARLVSAKPRQRAEAFLRTLGKWRDA